ncbi:ACP S-malonyltransferase [Streptomyces sp. NPDC048442]|uniref:ACP S-malonyltransferase n=1 Tax=Streptomyces sp. NPDC048442 TaxID=3154823 RepID=UPI00343F0BEE
MTAGLQEAAVTGVVRADGAWVFPGQGAQRKGMGAELFERHAGLLAEADEILGFSVRELCLTDPHRQLGLTRYLQPALYVVNALAWLDAREAGSAPGHLAGHSLGEYNALLAAGCFDFATGLRLVARRGELMGRAEGGGMSAVVGPGVGEVPRLLAEVGADDIDVANYNGPEQLVLSGPLDSLSAFAKVVKARKAGRCVPLGVSAAFHSRHMAPAAEEFARFLRDVDFAAPGIPVIANVTARPYPADGDAVRDLLSAQIRSSVRWREVMGYLRAHGVREVTELGPGTVLTGLWTSSRDDRGAWPGGGGQLAAAGPGTVADSAPAPPDAPAPADSIRTRTLVPPTPNLTLRITPERLGSVAFREEYGVRFAYVAGSMYKGVGSAELVARMGRAGLLGCFGAGGLRLERVAEAVRLLRRELGPEGRFGMNLLHALDDPALEDATVRLYLDHDVRLVEAAGFTQLTPALVRYRLSGAHRDRQGRAVTPRRLIAKVSRPEVAEAFLRPAPEPLLRRLVEEGALTPAEAEVGRDLSMAGDLCVEADSGGHTDGGVAQVLLPAMLSLRRTVAARHPAARDVRVGAAGGLGSPESVAAAFVLGADFVLTGSVNQCTVQAGTSDLVKDMLAGADVQDVAYAPAGDMFELGAQVQVLRKGTLFAARGNKLRKLYRQFESLDALDPAVRRTLEESCFRRGLDEVWELTRRHYLDSGRPHLVEQAERGPKQRMALVFRWYFAHSTRAALAGDAAERVNFQIHTGPAIGAFNRSVKGTALEDWRNRDVDAIAAYLMKGAAETLSERLSLLAQ